jgi:hypothetical protein
MKDKQKGQSETEKEENRQIQEFCKGSDTTLVFSRYERSLRYMFNFYSKQETKKITGNLSKDMETISFTEFIKFCF